ncbi:MAG: WecB/TagA/CpsF family glycosyltransferase [Sulfuricurvum sp.]|nr:WecB/TagA/CpsF family glycosyltransferase [Sulfuricurvum sp.]
MRKKIIDVLINIGKYEKFITNLFRLSQQSLSSYVCICNVHMVIEAYQNDEFCKVVNQADIVTPDGMPIAKSIKWLYEIEQDRVSGMDLMPDLIQKCAENNMSIFLYGSTDKILKKIIDKASIEFQNLKIESHSPPFRELNIDEKQDIINKINKFDPDFVFVALGCPKQEKWMAEHKGKINSCMIGLGGAFEVYAEVKDRAPKWMQDYSLEWLYRLLQDPKRLFKRYFITNNMFIWLFIKQLIRNYISNKEI